MRADSPANEANTGLIQGTLDMLILKTLSLEPMHGFGIARRVEQVSRGVFKVNPGSLLTALQRPDLARRVVVISGVFHRDGWIPAAIDPDAEPHEALARGHAELSPDGPDHFPAVAAKLRRMDFRRPE